MTALKNVGWFLAAWVFQLFWAVILFFDVTGNIVNVFDSLKQFIESFWWHLFLIPVVFAAVAALFSYENVRDKVLSVKGTLQQIGAFLSSRMQYVTLVIASIALILILTLITILIVVNRPITVAEGTVTPTPISETVSDLQETMPVTPTSTLTPTSPPPPTEIPTPTSTPSPCEQYGITIESHQNMDTVWTGPVTVYGEFQSRPPDGSIKLLSRDEKEFYWAEDNIINFFENDPVLDHLEGGTWHGTTHLFFRNPRYQIQIIVAYYKQPAIDDAKREGIVFNGTYKMHNWLPSSVEVCDTVTVIVSNN